MKKGTEPKLTCARIIFVIAEEKGVLNNNKRMWVRFVFEQIMAKEKKLQVQS